MNPPLDTADMPLSEDDLRGLLSLEPGSEGLADLFDRAYALKQSYFGNKVYLRGLIEVSNVCAKNCYYCGIRRDNRAVGRYTLTEEEILRAAKYADQTRMGSIVLQAGERTDKAFLDLIDSSLRRIVRETEGRLGITLSLGEQSRDTYRRWRDAGAHRYLLRIEASAPALYSQLHPADHRYENRLSCLRLLQECGYQTGTGVMIGLPGQTLDDLISDLMFFKSMDLDMIGMGPYLVHPDTPLAEHFPDFEKKREHQLLLGLKMIACARLYLRDVNLASTTALQALRPNGRELGILAGANVIMPNVTDDAHRKHYNLYDGKPGLDDSPESTFTKLNASLSRIGETLALGERGDPIHYYQRTLRSSKEHDTHHGTGQSGI